VNLSLDTEQYWFPAGALVLVPWARPLFSHRFVEYHMGQPDTEHFHYHRKFWYGQRMALHSDASD
jgi:hypothetical protein